MNWRMKVLQTSLRISNAIGTNWFFSISLVIVYLLYIYSIFGEHMSALILEGFSSSFFNPRVKMVSFDIQS